MAAIIIRFADYRSMSNDKNYSELSSSFLCQAYIYESLGKLRSSIWSQLHAARVYNDGSKILMQKDVN